jgi:hypothetical protein
MTNSTKKATIEDYLTAKAVPEGITLIEVDMSTCTFRRKLQYKDIGLAKDVESKLLSLGSKGVLGPDWAKKFRNIVEGTKRDLGMIGVPYGHNIWAIPSVRYEDALALAKGRELEFAQLKQMLLSRYDSEIESYAAEAEDLQMGFGDIVRQSAFTSDYINGQLNYRVASATDMENVVANKTLKQVGALASDYLNRLLKSSQEKGKPIEITSNTHEVLTKIHGFVKGMMFLDERLTVAHKALKNYIQTLPLKASAANPKQNQELVQLLVNLQDIVAFNAIAGGETAEMSTQEEEDLWAAKAPEFMPSKSVEPTIEESIDEDEDEDDDMLWSGSSEAVSSLKPEPEVDKSVEHTAEELTEEEDDSLMW